MKALIGGVIGTNVKLISSATEVSLDCKDLLTRREALAAPGNKAVRRFATSSDDVEEFGSFGERVLQMPLGTIEHIVL